jgi:hypothetical protein
MTTKTRVTEAASNVKPYVERAIQDEDLRENLKNAFDAARGVYYELLGPRPGVTGLASRVATDKDLQDQIRTAVDELRTAADRVQKGGHPSHKGRNFSILLVGVALGVLFNPVTGPETRRWVREALFGGGEKDDFGYSSSSSESSHSGNSGGSGSSSSGSGGSNPQ